MIKEKIEKSIEVLKKYICSNTVVADKELEGLYISGIKMGELKAKMEIRGWMLLQFKRKITPEERALIEALDTELDKNFNEISKKYEKSK